jgi:hypothetical protein
LVLEAALSQTVGTPHSEGLQPLVVATEERLLVVAEVVVLTPQVLLDCSPLPLPVDSETRVGIGPLQAMTAVVAEQEVLVGFLLVVLGVALKYLAAQVCMQYLLLADMATCLPHQQPFLLL